MFIGNQDAFKDRSRFYTHLRNTEKKKKVCRIHFRSIWKDGYAQCYEGFKKKEKCIELKDEK